MHSQTRDAECALGPALTAAGKVMGHVGGKMTVLCASLPSTGEARLKHRENPRALGTDREHLLLKAEEGWYQVCAMRGVRTVRLYSLVGAGPRAFGEMRSCLGARAVCGYALAPFGLCLVLPWLYVTALVLWSRVCILFMSWVLLNFPWYSRVSSRLVRFGVTRCWPVGCIFGALVLVQHQGI